MGVLGLGGLRGDKWWGDSLSSSVLAPSSKARSPERSVLGGRSMKMVPVLSHGTRVFRSGGQTSNMSRTLPPTEVDDPLFGPHRLPKTPNSPPNGGREGRVRWIIRLQVPSDHTDQMEPSLGCELMNCRRLALKIRDYRRGASSDSGCSVVASH